MQVTIDGVPYAPACAISSRIGIAITTHQRADVLKRALEQHMKHLPTGAMVVVVDDGSKPAAVGPDGVQLLRHETSLGIVASKNASLSALMDAGCEHLFLWDDDAWPIADDWHLPYIESPEPHLAYQFLDLADSKKLNDMACSAALMAVTFSVFVAGSNRVSGKAEAKAKLHRTEENAAAMVPAAECKAEVIIESSNVQQTVNHMSSDNVDRELRVA